MNASAQLALLYDDKRDIDAKFRDFHAANPEVYRLLVKFARQVKDSGRHKYSIWALFNRLRWHYEIDLKGEDPFKVNNNFTSRYSRLIAEQEPDLKDFFETRQLKSEREGEYPD